jgi:hypothetical protein
MRRIVLAIAILILGITSAQASDDWRVAFLKDTVGESGRLGSLTVVVISSTGTDEIAVPSDAIYANAQLNEAIISPDLRHLVISQRDYDTGLAFELVIVDLTTGACCTYVGTNEDIIAFDLGDFSPDMTQFSATYVGGDVTTGEIYGGLIAVDVALGMPTNSIDANTFQSAIGVWGTWAYMGRWTEEGVWFHPNCYGCEGVWSGEWAYWQPDSGAIIADTGKYFSVFSNATMLSNQETLLLDYDPRFYAPPGSLDLYVPTANIVKYTVGDFAVMYGAEQDLAGVYADDGGAPITSMTWVQNGEYYLVVNYLGRPTLVNRNGGTANYDFQLDPYGVLVGTPEGWIGLSYPSTPQSLVISANADIFYYPLTEQDRVLLLRDVPLGNASDSPVQPLATNGANGVISVAPTAFSAQSVPTLDPAVTNCIGFLPSRLVVGEYGAVTPGTPNNLRSQPDPASSKVGQIPGEAIFLVIDGPVCDTANSIAWWLVEYNGIQGWTAEGQAGTYYTEPLP